MLFRVLHAETGDAAVADLVKAAARLDADGLVNVCCPIGIAPSRTQDTSTAVATPYG